MVDGNLVVGHLGPIDRDWSPVAILWRLRPGLSLILVAKDVVLGKGVVWMPARTVFRRAVYGKRAWRVLPWTGQKGSDERIKLVLRRWVERVRALPRGPMNPHGLALSSILVMMATDYNALPKLNVEKHTSCSVSPRSKTTTPPKILPSAQYPATSATPRGY